VTEQKINNFMLRIEELVDLKIINNIVFGGAGFIGSHLIERLLRNNQNVICIDNLSSGSLNNLIHFKDNKNFYFIKHDILNEMSCKLLIEKIWHLASPASPKSYQSNPLTTIRTNFEGTLNILNLAKISNSKVLFTSTSEIYGITKQNPQFEDMPITLPTYSPRACYSEGKRIAETLLFNFEKIHSIEIRIARIFNTYGPRLGENDGRVISSFIYNAFNKKNLIIYGNGTQTRSFCYITDLIDGLVQLMHSNYPKPINLGNDSEISIIKLANLIRKKVNPKIDIEFYKLPIDDPEFRKPCLKLAKKYLNFEPIIDLEEGLDKFINFYKKNHYSQ
tara:strand:- start:460 stop:1461 length:1002 start_codon:yes stop_codon:yes gene_type:complete